MRRTLGSVENLDQSQKPEGASRDSCYRSPAQALVLVAAIGCTPSVFCRGNSMPLSKIYRARAATMAELAKNASAPKYKERFERMALAYERLAEKYAIRVYERKAKAGRDRRGRK